MAFLKNIYTQIANAFKEFIGGSNTGEYINDLALHYINRAQESLNVYRKWQGLTMIQTLTLSGKTTTAIPDGLIINVFEDTDGDGFPDKYYWNKSSNTSDGYFINNTFSKASGFTRTITFYSTPGSAPKMEYIKILEDFTGTGTEYSFFPANMLIAKAAMLYLEADGRIGTPEYVMHQNCLLNEIVDFCNATQAENIDIVNNIKDDFGNVTEVQGYNLIDGDELGSNGYNYDPIVDIR
ncbi:MAG: hypothetical protein EHM12_11365 [Dehalococcoidia bacterium]|nr:MAG: hypothetical protein EHM12_11365 [Dehalococcoidia bacterium]